MSTDAAAGGTSRRAPIYYYLESLMVNCDPASFPSGEPRFETRKEARERERQRTSEREGWKTISEKRLERWKDDRANWIVGSTFILFVNSLTSARYRRDPEMAKKRGVLSTLSRLHYSMPLPLYLSRTFVSALARKLPARC